MIAIFLKIFVVGIGYSMLRIIFRQKLITTSMMTKIVSAYFVFQILLLLFCSNFFLYWFGVYVSIALVFVFIFFLIHRQEIRFRSEFPDIVTTLLLQMKMGQSFRKCLQSYAQDGSKRYAQLMVFIFENVVFSPQEIDKKMTERNLFLHEVIAEFKKIDQATHKSIVKLENFRRRLIILQEFRRRSGRIRGQVHLQAGLLTFLYGLCFVVVSFMFPIQKYSALIMVSVFLFSIGLCGTFLIGRRIQWKI